MVKVGIVGSTGRVGSLLIDDLANDEQARVAAVHVFDKLKKQVPEDTIVTNDMRVLLDSSDVIIDFSAPSATEALLTEVIENGNGKQPRRWWWLPTQREYAVMVEVMDCSGGGGDGR